MPDPPAHGRVKGAPVTAGSLLHVRSQPLLVNINQALFITLGICELLRLFMGKAVGDCRKLPHK